MRAEEQRIRSRLYALKPLIDRLPEIKAPKRRTTLKEKIIVVALALVLFFIMAQIPLYGMAPEAGRTPFFGQLRLILASHAGTLMELGIGPIILAGVIMQLLVGSKIIGLDLTNSEDRVLYTGIWKLGVIFMAVFQASMLVISGWYGVTLGSAEGIFIVTQLTIGVIILVYLAEAVSKYGLGSGIGLFIVASVMGALFWQAFNPLQVGGQFIGAIPNFVGTMIGGGNISDAFFRPGLPNMMGVFATFIVFFIVIYAENIRVQIPLAYKRFEGIQGRYSIKFLYTSVIPILLAMIVFANIRVLGMIFSPLREVSYYLSAPHGIFAVAADPLRAVIYLTVLVFLCMGFAWLMINATSMGPRYLPEQSKRLGLSPLGSNRNAGAMDQTFIRQTMIFALLGGAFVGIISALADFTGALGSGSGIILSVAILYRIYEESIREHAWDIEIWRGKKIKFGGKVCPVCGSGSFVHSGTFSGWTFPTRHTAQNYICKNCGYVGSIVVELQSETDVEKLKQRYAREIKDGKKYSQPIFPPNWIPFWGAIALLFILLLMLPILSVFV